MTSAHLLYSSQLYTVFHRPAVGVEILQLASNETVWLQGDEADQLEHQLDQAPSYVQGDHLLDAYYGN